jgi:hypothetical protein
MEGSDIKNRSLRAGDRWEHCRSLRAGDRFDLDQSKN